MTPSGVATRSMTQAVRPLERRQHPADRVGQGGDLFEPARHRLDPLGIERQAVDERAGEALGARRLQVARVGGEDFAGARAQSHGGGGQRAVLGLGGGVGEDARRGPGLGADRPHRRAHVGGGGDGFEFDGLGHRRSARANGRLK